MRGRSQRGHRGVNLTRMIEPHGEADSCHPRSRRFGEATHEAVAVDVEQRCLAGEPMSRQAADHQEQVITYSFADLADEIQGDVAERIGLGPGDVLGPQPTLGPVVVGPSNPGDLETKPRVVE